MPDKSSNNSRELVGTSGFIVALHRNAEEFPLVPESRDCIPGNRDRRGGAAQAGPGELRLDLGEFPKIREVEFWSCLCFQAQTLWKTPLWV